MCLLTQWCYMKSKHILLVVLAAAAAGAFAQTPQVSLRPAPDERPRHDAAVTREQFAQRAAQRFEALDADKDGKITQAERQAARAARGQHGQHPPGIDSVQGAPLRPAR
jgi:hypothetical protein